MTSSADRRAPGDAPAGRALRLLARASWEAGPAITVLTLASELAVSLAQIAAIFGTKVVVDGAADGDLRHAVTGGLVVAGAMTLRQVCSWSDFLADLQERIAARLEGRVIDLSARLPGVEHHERPELLDQLQLVREHRFALGQIVSVVTGNLSTWTSAVATIVLLATIDARLLLVGAGAAASVLGAARAERAAAAAQERVAESHRLALALEEVVRQPRTAGELRLHRLGDLVLARHRAAGEHVAAVETPAQLLALRWDLAGVSLFTAAQLAAIGFVALRGTRGEVSPGDVVLAVGLVRRAASQLNSVIDGWSTLLRTLRAVRRLAWLEGEVKQALQAITPDHPAPAPQRLRHGIGLEHVTFRYPGASGDALHAVDLFLPAGATIALVGENGAGKSTIVKLLLRLYEPQEGRITVDGVDLRRIDLDDWRGRASGAFQDPARLELVASEVVGVGDLSRLEDEDALREAVREAGAEATVASLPAGLATPIGPSFEGGVELSGGQWQLLALARAMMRRRPLLLVLDEPTAALDAAREHALFERYAAAARSAAAETGGVTVLVSHRFSTVQMADLIAVVDGGRIAEHGTHVQLLAAGGLYAELFHLQARAYS